MQSVSDIRRTFLEYFRSNGHEVVASSPLVPRNDPTLDVHQRRHGAVQERLHRPRAAALQPRRDLAEMRARRRQAQRPRECRLHRPPPHLLRDAGQFLVRRLFQGTRDRAGVEPAGEGFRPAQGQAPGHGVPHRRRGGGILEEDLGAVGRQDHPHRHLGQFLGDGRDRTVRPVLGDLLRSRRRHSRRPARQSRPGRRPLHRDLEPGVHAVRAADAAAPRAAAQALDRYRHGAGAHRRGPAGQAQQLRHRPVPRPDRGGGARDRRRSRRPAIGVAQGDRRPSAHDLLPDRRRRAAVERGPRLRAAPHHAPRHAPCAHPRRAGSDRLQAGARPGARDGRCLSRAGARATADHRDAEARGSPLQEDPGHRPAAAR